MGARWLSRPVALLCPSSSPCSQPLRAPSSPAHEYLGLQGGCSGLVSCSRSPSWSPPLPRWASAAAGHRWRGWFKSPSAFSLSEPNYKRALKLSLVAAVVSAFLSLPLAAGWVNCPDTGAIVHRRGAAEARGPPCARGEPGTRHRQGCAVAPWGLGDAPSIPQHPQMQRSRGNDPLLGHGGARRGAGGTRGAPGVPLTVAPRRLPPGHTP